MNTVISLEITPVLLGVVILCGGMLYLDKGLFRCKVRAARNKSRQYGWRFVVREVFDIIRSRLLKKPKSLLASQRQDGIVRIAFYPTGGLGDYIISAKLLEELLLLAPCQIDVFAERLPFGQAVYGSRKCVRVLPYEGFELKRFGYDVALEVEHFVHVKNMDDYWVQEQSPELYQRLAYIVSNWDSLYVDIGKQCWRERIRFERCRLLGLDRWTELRMGKAFAIADHQIYIPMDRAYQSHLQDFELHEKGYVTINYGADVMRIGERQLKLWNPEYLAKLVVQLKSQHTDLTIVQLGGAQAEHVMGVDVYILGESLEFTKWVLRGARLHIDCEGGLVHLATQLGTRCVVLFGPTPVHMYGYEQNINICSLECSNCMGLHEDWAYRCYKHAGEAACMKSITTDLVFDAIETELSGKEAVYG